MEALKLWLDSYDDIYSDFDSRHFQKRRISEDFLAELRNELKFNKSFTENIVLLLPPKQRNETAEKIIASSLQSYFEKKYIYHQLECNKRLHIGIILFVTGFVVMLLNAAFSMHLKDTFGSLFVRILLEPAGWFLLWAAFDFLYYDFKKLKAERNIFKKLSQSTISFENIT